ncbi:hypothetical protein CEXT_140271 [Caerostris extrusa]|uniref:Uncharacterized protein n=1 Tax=Caerostris extrusa TaxID=172846 RepID=A0AAV4XQ53_CAEEX|nr:hypothetical protein CEXT_140271 [Caerostris extrusa]
MAFDLESANQFSVDKPPPVRDSIAFGMIHRFAFRITLSSANTQHLGLRRQLEKSQLFHRMEILWILLKFCYIDITRFEYNS